MTRPLSIVKSNKNEFNKINILTPYGLIGFTGKYDEDSSDEETSFYRTSSNKAMAFKREFMICILEDDDYTLTDIAGF